MRQTHSEFSERCLFCTVEVNVADVSRLAKAVEHHIVAIRLSIAFQSSKAHTLEHTHAYKSNISLLMSIEDSENENDRFQLAFKTEGVEGDKTTKIPIAVAFIRKLIGTPVLTPLGTITNNYQLAIPIPRYKRVQTVSQIRDRTEHPEYLPLIT